jgi:hypothetical protein
MVANPALAVLVNPGVPAQNFSCLARPGQLEDKARRGSLAPGRRPREPVANPRLLDLILFG